MKLASFDAVISSSHNLADDFVWQKVTADLAQGKYSATLWSPPCSTFVDSLRSPSGPELYGFRSMLARRGDEIRLDTLLVLRTIEGVRACIANGTPFILALPQPQPDVPTCLSLQEFQFIWLDPRVHKACCSQIFMGSSVLKPALLFLYNFDTLPLSLSSHSFHSAQDCYTWLLESLQQVQPKFVPMLAQSTHLMGQRRCARNDTSERIVQMSFVGASLIYDAVDTIVPLLAMNIIVSFLAGLSCALCNRLPSVP